MKRETDASRVEGKVTVAGRFFVIVCGFDAATPSDETENEYGHQHKKEDDSSAGVHCKIRLLERRI